MAARFPPLEKSRLGGRLTLMLWSFEDEDGEGLCPFSTEISYLSLAAVRMKRKHHQIRSLVRKDEAELVPWTKEKFTPLITSAFSSESARSWCTIQWA